MVNNSGSIYGSSMADTKWLTRNGGHTWHVVQFVPRNVDIGKKKLIRSLHTRDIKEAQSRRLAVLAEWQSMFAKARKGEPVRTGGTQGNVVSGTLTQVDGDYDWITVAERWGAGDDPASAGLVAEQAGILEQTHGKDAAETFTGLALRTATQLSHYVESWLAEITITPKTEKQYRADLTRFETWCRGQKVATVEAVTRKVAGHYADHLTRQGFTWATKNRKLTPLMAHWKWLIRRGHADASPWDRQSFRKEDQTRRAFTDEQMALLIHRSAGDLRDEIMFAALTGSRFGVIRSLRVHQIRDGWIQVLKDKSKAGVRRIPVHSGLAPILERRTAGAGPDALVFPVKKLSERFTRFRMSLGIDERTARVNASLTL